MSSIVRRRLQINLDALKQAFLLLAIVKELLSLFLPILRENVLLEDVHARFESLKANYTSSSDAGYSDSPELSKSESHNSESTCDCTRHAENPRLISAVRKLCRAIVQRDFKAASSILGANSRLASKRHEGGWFPLHTAVLSGDIDLVKLLLEYPKTDVNAVLDESPENRKVISALDREYELGTRLDGINGATPLHLACMIANVDIIRLLVDHGAFFKAKDAEQREPIEYFDTHGQSDAIAIYNNMYSEWKEHDKFFKRYNNVEDLAQLIRKYKYEIFKRTIERYPDLASRMTDDYFTLLHLAVIRRRRRFVELLISTDKALVNKRDVRSRYYSSDSSSFAPPTVPHKYVRKATPLHYACLVQDMDIAQMLLEAGADWNIEDSERRIPEDMIHEPKDTCYEMKSTFVRLRHAEEERRKEAGEKLRQSDDDADDDSPSKVSMTRASGKQKLAKQLALYLHGKDGMATDKDQNITKLEKNHGFVRIDMSEFQEPHTVFNLIGAPKSYVGYGDGGALTRPLKKNPKAVVLLDEIEKAHPDVLNTFLQVFDDGRITDSEDGVIYCKDAIFIMTSNIAGEEIKNAAPVLRQSAIKSEEEGRPESYIQLIQSFTRSIRPQLKQHLKRDEFIGRINQIVVFLPLSQEEIETAVQRELAMWCKRAEEKHKIKLTWTDEVVCKLASFYDVNYGVRSVANEVQRIAMQLVADTHIRGQLLDDWQAELATNEIGDIVMKACAKVPEDGYDYFSDFLGFFE
ncbi:hypothetical protein ACEPAH_3277 [Sanghuangporus vaninii]